MFKNNNPIFMQMSSVTEKKLGQYCILEVQAELFLKVECFSKFSIRHSLLKYSVWGGLIPTEEAAWSRCKRVSKIARDANCRAASHLDSLWSGQSWQGVGAGWKHVPDCSWASNGKMPLEYSEPDWKVVKQGQRWGQWDRFLFPPSAHKPKSFS